MAKVLVNESDLEDIADAIRSKNSTQNTYKPYEMASAIEAIPTGGGGGTVSVSGENLFLKNCNGEEFETFNITGNSKFKNPILPTEYTQLEYIEGTGAQYIDTMYVPNNLHFKIDFQFSKISPTRTDGIFGTYDSTIPRWGIYFYSTPTGFPSEGKYGCAYGNKNVYITSANLSDNAIRNVVIDFSQANGLICNVNNSEAYVDNYSEILTTYPLFIFRNNLNGNADTERIALIKLYYFKIYDGNILVRDLIPAKRISDNEVGMYDLITGVFHANAGTGSFIGGQKLQIKCCGDSESVNIVIDNNLNSADQEYQSQEYTIPVQQPMRRVNSYADTFVKQNNTWYEKHVIARINSYNGETITTDYMSTTGALTTGATVDYVLTTSTLLECTSAQVTALENLISNATTYAGYTHIYSTDTVSPIFDVEYLKQSSSV